MWEVKILNEEHMWMKNKKGSLQVISDHSALRLAAKGHVKLIRHYKILYKKKKCKTCGHIETTRTKKYTGLKYPELMK